MKFTKSEKIYLLLNSPNVHPQLKKTQRKKVNLYCKWCTSRLTLGFHFYQTITTWLEALLVNMSKLVLMFGGKFHCIKTINVRKKYIVQMRPLTRKLKIIIKFRATASSRIRKIFCVVIYIRKNCCKVKCVKSARKGRNVLDV